MPNRLAGEPSPYLLQHKDNPVEWWPWGEAAFEEARRRDVPVFLSIGYATCHWCHVMAHESFEDPGVARLMNDAFVCVKVDREERPDVDDVYMAVCQMMTGSGGWPLTIVMTPDKRPFLAATYIPKTSRFGRLGMLELIPRIQEAWQEKRKDLVAQADEVLRHLGHDAGEPPAELGEATLDAACEAFQRRFDKERGGFGTAPKFPSPSNLLFLLRHAQRRPGSSALAMVEGTLDAMARGGVRDHLGGGFHRYSTDAEWRLPHFEKMLYDQALLALAYTEAFQATGKTLHAEVARATLDYVLRDLRDPAGGFRSAEDADSEGEEGKFYVWTRKEVLGVVGPADEEAFCQAYGVAAGGNFRDEASGETSGSNVLHLPSWPSAEEECRLAPLRARLLSARSRRIRPLLDDKVLTDWNGLAVAAFARAGRALAEPRYLEAARQAAGFLLGRMRMPDGRLLHMWKAGESRPQSFLDDHAFVLWGLLELYEADFDPAHLKAAVEVADAMERHFADPKGGFFPTPHDAERLPARRKDSYDGALPSGNGIAAWCLLRLARMTGEPRFDALAGKALATFSGAAARHPHAFPALLMAVDFGVGPTREILVAGDDATARPFLDLLRRAYLPRAVLLRQAAGLAGVAPWTKEHPQGGAPQVFLCEGYTCRAPIRDLAGLKTALAAPKNP